MATSVKKTQTERERERTLDGGERERERAWKKARVYWYPFSGHRTSPNGGTFVLIRNPRRVIRSTGPRWIGKWPVGQQAKKGKVGGQEGGFTLVTRPIHRQATDEPPCASCAAVLPLLRLVSPCHAVNPIRDTDQSSARSCLYAASLLRLPRPALDRYLRTRTVLSVARLPHAQKKHPSCWNNFHRLNIQTPNVACIEGFYLDCGDIFGSNGSNFRYSILEFWFLTRTKMLNPSSSFQVGRFDSNLPLNG